MAFAVALACSVVLSCWWAPFGWDAWGDRLMIPAMLGTIICLTTTARERGLGPQDVPSRWGECETEAPRRRRARLVRDGAIALLVLVSLHFTVVSYYGNEELEGMLEAAGAHVVARDIQREDIGRLELVLRKTNTTLVATPTAP